MHTSSVRNGVALMALLVLPASVPVGSVNAAAENASIAVNPENKLQAPEPSAAAVIPGTEPSSATLGVVDTAPGGVLENLVTPKIGLGATGNQANLEFIVALTESLAERNGRLTQSEAELYFRQLLEAAQAAEGLSGEAAKSLQTATARFIENVNAHPPVATVWHQQLATLGSTLSKAALGTSQVSPNLTLTPEMFDLLLATSLAFQAARDIPAAIQVQKNLFQLVQAAPGVLDIRRELAFRRDFARLLLAGGEYENAIQGAQDSLLVAENARDGFSYVVLLRTIGMGFALQGRYGEAVSKFDSRPAWTVQTVTGFNELELDFELESSVVKLGYGTLSREQMVAVITAQRYFSRQMDKPNYLKSREGMLGICAEIFNPGQLANRLLQRIVHEQ